MYQKTIISFVLSLWFYFAGAQVITGIICDKATKQPISDVYVVIDGTSIRTITDISGRFELNADAEINAKMVLHHTSYHLTFIESPFDELPDTLYIEERVNGIREVIVTATRSVTTRRDKIIKRVAVVDFFIEEDNSISSVKLIRSSGYPSIDAIALWRASDISNLPPGLGRGKNRFKLTYRFDRNRPPTGHP